MFLLVRNRPRRFEPFFRRHPCYTKLMSEDGTQQHIFLMTTRYPRLKITNLVLNGFAKATFHSKLYR